MADIFISFIHEEEYASALQLLLAFVIEGHHRPFMSSDKFHVYAGERWIERIMAELAQAKVVLLMLSPTSVKRPWVNFEAGAAWTRAITTIPVCIRGLKKGDLPKPYSSLQAVDLGTLSEHLYLVRSIAHHLGIEDKVVIPFPRIAVTTGGPEAKKKAEGAMEAYERFQERLEMLDDHEQLRTTARKRRMPGRR